MPNTNLGSELQQLSHLLGALIIKEPDINKADRLRAQQIEVLEKIQVLVDGQVDKATDEYRKARKGVETANDMVIQAMQDLQKVADTINTVAQALEALGKLAEMMS